MNKLKRWDFLIFVPIIGIYKSVQLIIQDRLPRFLIVVSGFLHGFYIKKLTELL
jgi:hypothetical protein